MPEVHLVTLVKCLFGNKADLVKGDKEEYNLETDEFSVAYELPVKAWANSSALKNLVSEAPSRVEARREKEDDYSRSNLSTANVAVLELLPHLLDPYSLLSVGF